MSKLDKVEEVDIDAEGRMKYILIEVEDATGKMKTIVRGYKWADYHADILDKVSPKLEEYALTYECVGGGRIEHDSKNKKILVYGYSMGFGRADHSIAVEKLKVKFSDYESIDFKNEGY
jgi:phosphohistidine phosphatase